MRRIIGSGPTPCRVLLVGEAGGAEENEQRRPFVGKAGMVLDTYLAAVGIPRKTVHVDNIWPYWTGYGNPDPTPRQISDGGRLLRETLARVKPQIIGCLGRISAQWFLGDKFEMKRDHGLLFVRDGRVIVPCVHPAAGFYDASASAMCQADIAVLASVIKAKEIEVPVGVPLPDSRKVVYPYKESGDIRPQDGDAFDTEGSIEKPLMVSWANGRGSYAAYTLPVPIVLPKRLTFHYGLHDIKVLRAMGADTDQLDWDDTIVMAFDLMGGGQDNSGDRTSPLGLSLKVLAHRELGVEMKDYIDVVRPHYNAEVEDYINKILDSKLPAKSKPRLVEVKGEQKIYTPQPPKRRFSAVLLDALTGGEPEKRWADLPEEMKVLGEKKAGPFPTLSTAISRVPMDEAVRYSGADAWATQKLATIYRKRLKERGLERVYEIDRKALPFVDEIQRNGLPIDVAATRRLKAKLERKAETITREMRRFTGKPTFNPGSRDDVAWFLYHKMSLQAPRVTEGGADSTDEKSIKILRQRTGESLHPEDTRVFLDQLLDYRECRKYIGTYLEYMMEKSVETPIGWRLFPDDLSTTRVVSGRLSGRLLTFPTRTELGAEIRKCFVARPGWKILSVDLSQIELRFMAEMSQDPVMLQAFLKGEDLHALTASKLFKVALDKVTKVQRYVAKTLNFAILYGISAKSLLEQLAVAGIYEYNQPDCERFIEEWFRLYNGVLKYLRKLWFESGKTGEVRDWCGRVRYVPNIRLPESQLKEKARRDVGNFPIQAGARELVKIAQGEMVPWLRGAREVILAILDVHDECLFEVDEDVVEEAGEIVRGHMVGEGRRRFGVPIEAGVSWGDNWGAAK